MKSVAVIFGLLAAGVLLCQSTATSPWIGTWKVNVAKSTFSPGPPPKSQTVTIAEGKVTVDEESADGKTAHWSYAPSNGAEVPIDGLQEASVTSTEKGNMVEHKWKIGKESYTGHGVIMKDGKTMKYVFDGTDAQGRHVHDVTFYEKE
ncbi:MAG: hypothetical protein JOY54_20705 [Acidobacteriaceae bacterium]|nr:hypothetical protein [Acidobacteriaceae bacterium]